MKERTPLFLAAGIGALAVGGLTLYARHANSPVPRVLGQHIEPATAYRGAYVRLDIEPSPALLRLAKEGEAVEYRIAEPGGRIFWHDLNGVEDTRIRIPYTYVRPPISPRLEVWRDGQLLGWAELGSLPPPRVQHLSTVADSPLRAFHASGDPSEFDMERTGRVRFASRRPLSASEYWTIDVLQTPTESPVLAQAGVRAGKPPSDGFDEAPLHNADEIGAVRVRVTRWVHRKRSERVTISGIRILQKEKWPPTLAWEGRRIPNHLGLDLRYLPSPYAEYAQMNFSNPSLKSFALNRGTVDKGWRALQEEFRCAFDAPDFARLGIRQLTIASASWKSNAPIRGPIDRRPFSVALILTKDWNEKGDTFETTIPVEPAP